MTRIVGPAGSRRRRRFLLTPVLVAMTVGLMMIGGAGAVHNTGAFELDGNATNDPAVPGDDWDNVCHEVLGSDCSTSNDTSGSSAVSWTAELDRSASIFTGGGSKDPEDISAWKWKDGGGLPDKDNLLHGFAVRYSLPSTGASTGTCPSGTNPTCEVIYFGSDRFDNSGDAVQGFWFLQNNITLNADGTFDSANDPEFHRVGDILVVSDFSNGGDVSTINVFEWVGSGGDTASGTLQSLGGGTNKRCQASLPENDAFCGIVNPLNGTTAPWPFLDKSGNTTYLQGEFFEGGINLSLLPAGIASQCFASFLSESRSSTSPTATLKDFVLGAFAPCETTLETTPLDGAGNPISGPLSIGTGSVSVRDRAVLTVEGTNTFDGTITFFLCKLDSPDLCDDSDAAHHGTQIGAAQTISGPSPVTVTSDAATVTSVGRYCWRADYSGDAGAGVPPASDSRATECFTVSPVTPTLTTQASGPVALGNPISDTATLTGTANQPGTPVINPTTAGAPANGTITFTAFGPNDCTTVAFGPVTRIVSGDGTYPTAAQAAVSFTPTAVGTYTWVASYSGDPPNTNPVPASACPDTTGTETVVVTDTTSVTTAQDWLPNDTATITSAGGSALSGSVSFTLFSGDACSGAVLYTEGPIAVSGASPQMRSTSNTTVKVTASASVSWRVTYTSNNPNVGGSTSNCETTSLVITN
jgi:hypothetical protein